MGIIDSFYVDNEYYYYQDSFIAPEFEPNSNYRSGNLVFYNGDLYICVSDESIYGEWDEISSDFWQMTISDIVSMFFSEFFGTNGFMAYLEEGFNRLDDALDTLSSTITEVDFSQFDTNNIFSVTDSTGITNYYEVEYSAGVPISLSNMATTERITFNW